MFGEMYEEYLQTFYLLADHRGIERWYYNTTDPTLSVKEMEKTEEICNQYVDLLKNVNKIFNMSRLSPVILECLKFNTISRNIFFELICAGTNCAF